METVLKVTPERLTETATDFGNRGKAINSLTSEMLALANGLTNAWEGEASEAYKSKFQGLDKDMQTIFNMINEHVKDLNEIAQLYQNAEKESQSTIETLTNNVLD